MADSTRPVIDTFAAPQADGRIVYQPFSVPASGAPAPADLVCLGLSFAVVGGILLLIAYNLRQ